MNYIFIGNFLLSYSLYPLVPLSSSPLFPYFLPNVILPL
jgi:hypothetical protein